MLYAVDGSCPDAAPVPSWDTAPPTHHTGERHNTTHERERTMDTSQHLARQPMPRRVADALLDRIAPVTKPDTSRLDHWDGILLDDLPDGSCRRCGGQWQDTPTDSPFYGVAPRARRHNDGCSLIDWDES
jgi:hypothetical protein